MGIGIDLPDAPWIRDAETNGMPEAEEIEYVCPVCGAENPEDFCLDRDGDIIGCRECCGFHDAYEYMIDRKNGIRRVHR